MMANCIFANCMHASRQANQWLILFHPNTFHRQQQKWPFLLAVDAVGATNKREKCVQTKRTIVNTISEFSLVNKQLFNCFNIIVDRRMLPLYRCALSNHNFSISCIHYWMFFFFQAHSMCWTTTTTTTKKLNAHTTFSEQHRSRVTHRHTHSNKFSILLFLLDVNEHNDERIRRRKYKHLSILTFTKLLVLISKFCYSNQTRGNTNK